MEPEDDDNLDLADLARLCGMKPEHILAYSRASVITLRSQGGVHRAGAHTLHRLRRISSLETEHGIPPEAARHVLGLLERMEALERELRELRERL